MMNEKVVKKSNDKTTKAKIEKGKAKTGKEEKKRPESEKGNRQGRCIQVIEILRKEFPQVFKSGKEVKPLKIGIRKDLFNIIKQVPNSPISGGDCRKALYYYTRNPYYQKALSQPKAERIDLTGKPVSAVNSKDAEYGRSQYERWLKIRTKKRKDFPNLDKNTDACKN